MIPLLFSSHPNVLTLLTIIIKCVLFLLLRESSSFIPQQFPLVKQTKLDNGPEGTDLYLPVNVETKYTKLTLTEVTKWFRKSFNLADFLHDGHLETLNYSITLFLFIHWLCVRGVHHIILSLSLFASIYTTQVMETQLKFLSYFSLKKYRNIYISQKIIIRTRVWKNGTIVSFIPQDLSFLQLEWARNS